MNSAVIFQIQSFIILSLLYIGVFAAIRGKRQLHMRIMKISITWDLLLIAQIELTRSAIKTASMAMENSVILNIHILLAICTVLLYAFMYLTGKKVSQGQVKLTKKHRLLGATTIIFRTLTFITSFVILE